LLRRPGASKRRCLLRGRRCGEGFGKIGLRM
jgi:hypothetical protein